LQRDERTVIDLTRNLRPDEIAELARGDDRQRFREAVGVPLLLVRIQDEAGELFTTLSEGGSARSSARVEVPMGFETVSEGRKDSGSRAPRSMRPIGGVQVRVRLLRGVHVAVPLRKRVDAGKAFSDRISVGRARNNDLVLRHESVSKFHAWFRCGDDGTFVIGDAMSHNGTYLNDDRIPLGASVAVAAGATLRFGVVEALLLEPEILWDALHVRV
jgi:FHA domain